MIIVGNTLAVRALRRPLCQRQATLYVLSQM
jgi:hypothetical protein